MEQREGLCHADDAGEGYSSRSKAHIRLGALRSKFGTCLWKWQVGTRDDAVWEHWRQELTLVVGLGLNNCMPKPQL